MTGSAFLPWGEIEPEKLRVTKGANSLLVDGDVEAAHAVRFGECWRAYSRSTTAQGRGPGLTLEQPPGRDLLGTPPSGTRGGKFATQSEHPRT
jgi:hypothetical protein